MFSSFRVMVVFIVVSLLLIGSLYVSSVVHKAEIVKLTAERDAALSQLKQQQDLAAVQNAAIDELKNSADARQKAAAKEIANAKTVTDTATKRADKIYSARSREDNCSDALSIVNGRW